MSNKKIVVSIDPGDRFVGVYFHLSHLENWGYIIKQYDRKEWNVVDILADIRRRTRRLAKMVPFDKENQAKVIVIVEKFLNYNHKVNIKGYTENKTSELIGAIRIEVEHINSFIDIEEYKIELVMQSASQAKVWTNERLIKLGLFRKEGNKFYLNWDEIPKHTRDAYRHFIYYTNKNWFDKCITKEKLQPSKTKVWDLTKWKGGTLCEMCRFVNYGVGYENIELCPMCSW